MPHWTDSSTRALESAEKSLKTVENLLSFVKGGQGKPSAKERAIFAAAVVFLYGVWENYVEQLAIELVTELSKEVDPARIPEQVKKSLEKKSAWELTISPGWRALWVQTIKISAIGDDGERFGMNTARAGQVKNLLATAGSTNAFQNASQDTIPEHIAPTVKSIEDAVDQLVTLRGEIVHTGQVPASLRKAHVLGWESFVQNLCESLDSTSRAQCKALTA